MKKLIYIFLTLVFMCGNAFALTQKQEDDITRDFLWEHFLALPKEHRPKVGLTLSAGGMRGFSHVGAMEVIRESGLPIDYLTGTSMGCIVGSLYAAGVPTERMWQIAANPKFSYISKDITVIGVLRYALGNKLFSSENFESFISGEVGGLYYEDLRIPFACVSADIKTGEKVVFDSGPVALGVRSSMNLPGIFAPVEYRQRYLVDGGVVDYMPVDVVRDMGADWVLAIYALPDYSKTVPNTILGYIVRTGDIRGAFLTYGSEKNADYVIASRVGDIEITDKNDAVRAIEVGAKTTFNALNSLKENLLLFSVKYVVIE